MRSHHRYALIALIWSLSALVIAAWLGCENCSAIISRPLASAAEQNTDVAGVSTLGAFIVQDTLAQWTMAVFSIAATAVSLWAVTLLRETLRATREAVRSADDAVRVARELGQAQIRAYISWAGARLGEGRDSSNKLTFVKIAAQIKNTGQSPAFLSAMYSTILLLDDGRDPACSFNISEAICSEIIGSGSEFDFVSHYIEIEDVVLINKGEKKCYLMGWVSYRTVFAGRTDPDNLTSFCYELIVPVPPETMPLGAFVANTNLLFRDRYWIGASSSIS